MRHLRERVGPTVVALIAAALAVFVLSGCATSTKYRMAKDAAPPVAPLNYTAGVPALELRLLAVIVHQGPGSWKQEALWDEYVVSLTNHGSGPLTAESVVLVDLVGVNQLPGADPWTLEKLSEANWEQYSQLERFVLGAGAAAGAMELSAVGYGLAGGTAVGAVFFLMPAVLIANVAVVAVMDHNNKEKVQQEFERRRLALPLDLAAGTTLQGSLFFPMAPGPQRLILQGKAGETPLVVELDLKPLAGLHLYPPAQQNRAMPVVTTSNRGAEAY